MYPAVLHPHFGLSYTIVITIYMYVLKAFKLFLYSSKILLRTAHYNIHSFFVLSVCLTGDVGAKKIIGKRGKLLVIDIDCSHRNPQ